MRKPRIVKDLGCGVYEVDVECVSRTCRNNICMSQETLEGWKDLDRWERKDVATALCHDCEDSERRVLSMNAMDVDYESLPDDLR